MKQMIAVAFVALTFAPLTSRADEWTEVSVLALPSTSAEMAVGTPELRRSSVVRDGKYVKAWFRTT